MGTLTDSIQTLQEDIADMKMAQEKRFNALMEKMNSTEQDVARMLSQFRKELAEVTAADRTARQERLGELRNEVRQLSDEVAAKLQQFRRELSEDAAQGRRERPEAVLEAEAFMETLRREMAALKSEMAEERKQSQQQAKQERVAFLEHVRLSVNDILNAARTAREQYRSEQDDARRARAEQRVSAPQTAKPQAQSAPQHSAKPSHDPVGQAAASGVGAAAPAPRPEASAESTQASGDGSYEHARAVLNSSLGSDVADAASRPDATKTPAVAMSAEGAGRGTQDASSGDLTRIEGIGPRMALLLQRVGYGTLAGLAQASTTELEEKVGHLPGFVDVASWIRQAKELTS